MDQIGRDESKHGDDSYGSRSGVLTEWMFQDVYDVEEWYVCSSSSHQARCGVALDMGHSRPAGHKWAQGSPHDVKWGWTGCYAEQCRLVALGAGLEARFREPSALWRGRQAYTASASGAPRGYRTLSASHRDWLP